MTDRKLTAAEQDEVARLVPYATKLVRLLLTDPDTGRLAVGRDLYQDAVSEAHLLLCQAILACPVKDPEGRRFWAGDFVMKRLVDYLRREQKGRTGKKRKLSYTPFRPLTVHDVIARLPAHLQPVALARWTERHRRKPWASVAQEEGISIPEARSRLSEARDLATAILNDEATDVLSDDPDDPVDERPDPGPPQVCDQAGADSCPPSRY